MQFYVSKSPPFNVTSVITVQLVCSNTQAVNPFHPQSIREFPINSSYPSHSPNVTHNISTHYPSIQSILHSSTQLISSHNISPLFKQFHSPRFLSIATHYNITLCTDIRYCRRGFTTIKFCLVYYHIVLPILIKTQY